MKVNIHWQDDMHFQTRTQSGHTFSLDAAVEVGGQNRGPRPTEVLLSAVGTCSGIDIIAILKKMRQKVTAFDVELEGTRQEEHPRRFQHIQLHYRLEGELSEDKVRRAIQLSLDKYCSVSNSLNATVQASFEINGQRYSM